MQYCKKCGASIDVNTGNCSFCGMNPQAYSVVKDKIVLIVTLALTIVFMVGVGVLLVGAGAYNDYRSEVDVSTDDGYLDIVENCVNGLYVEGNYEALFELMPDEVFETFLDNNFDGDEDAFDDAMVAYKEKISSYGIDVESVSWEIAEEMDLVAANLTNYQRLYREQYNGKGKLEAAKGVRVAVSYTCAEGEKNENMDLIVILIDDEWYLLEAN